MLRLHLQMQLLNIGFNISCNVLSFDKKMKWNEPSNKISINLWSIMVFHIKIITFLTKKFLVSWNDNYFLLTSLKNWFGKIIHFISRLPFSFITFLFFFIEKPNFTTFFFTFCLILVSTRLILVLSDILYLAVLLSYFSLNLFLNLKYLRILFCSEIFSI